MPRLLRIAGSFAIVLVLYWTYALVAVPLIEPSVDQTAAKILSEERIKEAHAAPDRRLAQLRPLFRPGSWELDHPKILESSQVMLLLRDYTNLRDGRVELRPCTMIFFPENTTGTPESRIRQAVVLEAPNGALLQFDEPFDLRRAKIGRLESGRLTGRITIRGAGKSPGPEDDLLITTRDVELTEQEITTPHLVRFRMGPHHGTGRDMHIRLLSGEGEDGDTHGPDIAGIESFEMRHVDRLHLEFDESSEEGKKPQAPGQKKIPRARAIEVTCRGPFLFDMVRQSATFSDQVDVLQLRANGPADQLNCEWLLVQFVPRTKASAALDGPQGEKKANSGALDLEPYRVEARGNPVVLRSPSRAVEARGELLDYNLSSGRILLDGQREVFLQQGPNEIHARKLQYDYTDATTLGQVSAKGPGWFRGQMDQQPEERLEARWNELLHVRPDRENAASTLKDSRSQVISLTGGTVLQYGGLGRLEAEEVHFWILEVPGKGKEASSRFQPDRMMAQNGVRLASPQLSGKVERLEVWFKEVEASAWSQPSAEKTLSDWRGASPAPQPLVPAVANPLIAGPGGPMALVPRAAVPEQHFEITGQLLRARIDRHEQQAELSELTIEGGVRFRETKTANPGERPLVIRGDRIHVVDASKPHAAVTVTGRPAYFEGRGLGLTGSNINLNRGTNRLWIDGPGRMDLPLDRDLQGNPMPDAGPLVIDWQTRMSFDGRGTIFEDSVIASTRQQQLRTETLEVQFQETIHFSAPDIQKQPKLAQVLCRGGVLMESRTFDEEGQKTFDRVEVPDLAINMTSGAMTAGGPGRVTTVRRGFADPITAASSTEAEPPDSGSGPLTYLDVAYQGSIRGNIHQQETSFHDQVRTVYGPVATWESTLEAEDPDALGDSGAVLRCNTLTARQMIAPGGADTAMELEAVGNTSVEGRTFTARGSRLTYAESKDLLILEGDGRTDAELFRQQTIGGPTTTASAQKILYWPSTRRMKVDGARSLQLDPADSPGFNPPSTAGRPR